MGSCAFLALISTHDPWSVRVRWMCRKRRSGVLWGCRVLTRAHGDTLAHDNFHLIGVQSGPVKYRRRVGSTGSDGCEVSESVRWSLVGPTWLPWFSPASGACRAPDDGLGFRASVSGSERANSAVDEPCRSRCVQNSGGFIIWRAAYLRTSAPPKPPATHGRAAVSRTLLRQPRALHIHCVLMIKNRQNWLYPNMTPSAFRRRFGRVTLKTQ